LSKHHRYAVLGLGLMGTRIANRLAGLGHEVTGWNRTPCRELAASCPGVKIKASPGQAALGADAVLLWLHDANAVRDVVFKTDLIGSLTPDSVVIDMGTNDPDTALAIGDRLQGKTVFVDGPVSGGTVAAEEGALAIFLGADEPLAQRVAPLLAPLGNPAAFGRLGKGQTAKLANQVAVAITIAALAETLAFAEHLELPTDVLVATMSGGLAGSRVMDVMGPRLLANDLTPRGRAATHLKDLAAVFELVPDQTDVLPATRAARDHLLALGERAHDLDHGAMLVSARAALADAKQKCTPVTTVEISDHA